LLTCPCPSTARPPRAQLHRALKKSHESEKRLVKKARELNAEIVQNAQKVQTALKLSQEDQNTIASLKREIEKAWKMVDAAHDKEGRAKDTIGQLKTEIANLSRLVEQGAGLSIGQENTVNELMKVKNDLMRERDTATAQVGALRAETERYLHEIAASEQAATAQGAQIEAHREQIALRKADAEKEAARKAALEAELRELREALDSRQTQLRNDVAAIAKTQEGISRCEHHLRDERARTDRTAKEGDVLGARNSKQASQVDEMAHGAQQLVKEGAERAVELRMREEEIVQHRKEIGRINAQIEGLSRRGEATAHATQKLDGECLELKRTLNALELELQEARRLHEGEGKAKLALGRERDLLNKQLVKSQALTHKQADAVRIFENQRKNLEQEIGAFRSEAFLQRKAILTLEKDRETLQHDVRDAAARQAAAAEELRTREVAVVSLQRRIVDVDNKLKQQQNLYEAVRADRNLYNKNLIEARDEIGEMRRKFKIMNHQIEQLKEEIHFKDSSLVREHFDHMKVVKERDALREEVGRVKRQTGVADDTITNYKLELAKLSAVIGEADSEQARQAKEQEVVLNERDLLGLQLIRRNEELSLLYEKIRIHDSMLGKGQTQYEHVTTTVRTLRGRLAELRAQVETLRASVVNVTSIRDEVYHLSRELMHERTKVKALESELANPLNVHRWRKLEGARRASERVAPARPYGAQPHAPRTPRLCRGLTCCLAFLPSIPSLRAPLLVRARLRPGCVRDDPKDPGAAEAAHRKGERGGGQVERARAEGPPLLRAQGHPRASAWPRDRRTARRLPRVAARKGPAGRADGLGARHVRAARDPARRQTSAALRARRAHWRVPLRAASGRAQVPRASHGVPRRDRPDRARAARGQGQILRAEAEGAEPPRARAHRADKSYDGDGRRAGARELTALHGRRLLAAATLRP
jgi:chromosome segregation ATPase